MINIHCFKWRPSRQGFALPGVPEGGYTSHHVNTLFKMLQRHAGVPFKLHCHTDDPTGINDGVCIMPLPGAKVAHMGGCFRRLEMFALCSARTVMIDLDVVICGGIKHILTREEPFLIHNYTGDKKDQKYNGALISFKGQHRRIWDDFADAPEEAEARMRHSCLSIIGTDQAWLRYKLGENMPTIGEHEGVYEARTIKGNLPSNACMVFFSGARQPDTCLHAWARAHYS